MWCRMSSTTTTSLGHPPWSVRPTPRCPPSASSVTSSASRGWLWTHLMACLWCEHSRQAGMAGTQACRQAGRQLGRQTDGPTDGQCLACGRGGRLVHSVHVALLQDFIACTHHHSVACGVLLHCCCASWPAVSCCVLCCAVHDVV